MQRAGPDLERLRQRLTANNLLCPSHEDLMPLPAGVSYDRELIHLVGRYGLDTSDAAILLEARRAGVIDLVTLDLDWRRAHVDFDVHTWL